MAFTHDDLLDLKRFLSQATDVVPYGDVAKGWALPGSVAMRHDVDHSLRKAAGFAEWEYANGYKSTYFILHSAPYWQDDDFSDLVRQIADCGHEIGLHNDALNAADGNLDTAGELITLYLTQLESCIGEDYEVIGIADHGGAPHTNGDIWDHFTPATFGLEYEAYQLQKEANTYISDNQGKWRSPLVMAQTFMLIHPIHWPI